MDTPSVHIHVSVLIASDDFRFIIFLAGKFTPMPHMYYERALPSCSIYSLSAFPRNTIGSCRQSYGDLAIPGHPLRALSLICAFDKYLVLDSSGHQEKASRAKRHTFASFELAVAWTDGCLGNSRITPIDVRVSDHEQAGQVMSTCDWIFVTRAWGQEAYTREFHSLGHRSSG